MREADVFEFDSSLVKNKASQLGTASTRVVEIAKLVNGHAKWNLNVIKLELSNSFLLRLTWSSGDLFEGSESYAESVLPFGLLNG